MQPTQRTVVPSVDVESIATPKSQLLAIKNGEDYSALLKLASERSFDYLPVMDHDDSLLGISSLERLLALKDDGKLIWTIDEGATYRTIPDRIQIIELLDLLAANGVLVVEDTDGVRPGGWFALLTPADLNRHVFRGYLYPLFAVLESELARLIETEFRLEVSSIYNDFIRKIPKYNRATVLGRWELDKLENVETGLLAGCTLSDLLEILKQTKALVERLGLSGKQLKRMSAALNDLRNGVMHPVRPIVRGESGVKDLRRDVADLVSLIESVQTLLADMDLDD